MAATLGKDVQMRDLYAPELLRVVVGPNKRTFSVPRGLICNKSVYFDKAFQRLFLEGQQGSIDLPDVKEWVFECFTAWLYTQRIFWEPLDGTLDKEGPSPQVRNVNWPENAYDEDDRQNPVTWQYQYLIQLYLFGDQYDTKDFRNAVMCHFQVKTQQTRPKNYLWPHDFHSRVTFESLPETAALYRFLVDAHVFGINPDGVNKKTEFVNLPADALSRIAKKAIQLARCLDCSDCLAGRKCTQKSHPDVKRKNPDFDYDMCSYHEHDTDGERGACQKMWKELCKTHGIKMLT